MILAPLARRLSFAVVLVAVSTLAVVAGEKTITVADPWIRATPDGAAVAGGFAVIANAGSEADRLVGGSADFADKVEIHEMAMDGEVMRMRALKDGLEIPAGGGVTLKPGSYHVMFMKLRRALREGDALDGTLVFAKAGSVPVTWTVRAMGAMMPGDKMKAMPKD